MNKDNWRPLEEPDFNPDSIEFTRRIPRCQLCGDKISGQDGNICKECNEIDIADHGNPCAHCDKEDGIIRPMGVSHGICDRHIAIEEKKIEKYKTDKELLCGGAK